MAIRHRARVLIVLLSILVGGCGTAGPASAPVTGGDTPVPPTATVPPDIQAPTTPAVLPSDTPPPPTPAAVPQTDTTMGSLSLPIQAALGNTWSRPADGMPMVYVPGGTFPMGSTEAEVADALARCREAYSHCNADFYGREAPQHTVTLDSFWLDRTEVTQAHYLRCVEAGACQLSTTCAEGQPMSADTAKAQHPAVCVNWQDAEAYCAWAGTRLPTEAEWEYAARGPEGHRYPWGNEPGGAWQNYCDANCTHPWADEMVDDGYAQTSPVDHFPEGTSWCGVQDLAGNVYEWVADWSAKYAPASQTNPTGPASGFDKVLRGSSWKSFWDRARGATRDAVRPDRRAGYIGFRCAASPEG